MERNGKEWEGSERRGRLEEHEEGTRIRRGEDEERDKD